MFKFFINRNWALWAYVGSFTILISIWLQVQIDVKINYWFGEFYDLIQKALGTPNAVTLDEYFSSLLVFVLKRETLTEFLSIFPKFAS